MATHSSILAGRIQRAEEPSGLQAMALKESDMTKVAQHTPICTNSKPQQPNHSLTWVLEVFHCLLDRFPHPRVFMALQFFFNGSKMHITKFTFLTIFKIWLNFPALLHQLRIFTFQVNFTSSISSLILYVITLEEYLREY